MRSIDRASRRQSTGAADRRTDSTRNRGYGRAIAASIVAINAAVIIWLWIYDGGVSGVHSVAGIFTSLGRITGLLGAYLLLLQVLLLARLRWLERLVGLDRLTIWHRLNGFFCLYLIVAHVVLITVGYALTDRLGIPQEITTLLGTYPDMIPAALGTGLLVLVVVTSLVIVRRRLRYEAWYAVHLTAYAAIVLAWFHQLPTGNEFVLNAAAATYWTALYLITLALVLVFRLALPIAYGFRHQMRVAEVNIESPTVVSLRITGRHLDRMGARAGQFFLWRFMTWKLMWQSHPFSLSAAPDGRSLRITIKNLGDFTSRIGEIAPGTRVIGVGPFGLFVDAVRQRDRVVLIAGGVGITPIRALAEDMPNDTVLIYRVQNEGDVVFREELDELARERGITVHYIVGDHRDPGNRHLMSAEHLLQLVPDIAQREVYVCGPPAMSTFIESNVRKAGVAEKYLHSESFAFSPGPQPSQGSRRFLPARKSIVALIAAAIAAAAAALAWLVTYGSSNAPRTTLASSAKPTAAPLATSTPAPQKRATSVPAVQSGPTQDVGPVVTEQYGAVQATITVRNGRISDVAITAPQDNPRSASINSQAVPILRSETLTAQSATVNTVSGATFTSNAYVQSLQGAIAKARQAKTLA